MAGVQLGSVAEGTVVKIKIDGSLRNFCVAKHDYEITLNGYGRTLLVDINYLETCGWSTTFYYTPGYNNKNVSTLSRAVFALSDTERGFSETRMNVEGEPLSAGVLAKITDSSATWTRSPDTRSTSTV